MHNLISLINPWHALNRIGIARSSAMIRRGLLRGKLEHWKLLEASEYDKFAMLNQLTRRA